MEKVLHTKWGTASINNYGYYRITSRKEGNLKDTIIDGGNVKCRYSYYGLNRLRCSRPGNEGNYCQYWKDCIHFEYCDLEID